MNIPKDIYNTYKLACRGESNVLITGDTGTGKTFLAREIHQNSARRGGPFITINLATLHEGTLESELFGHEKGAFTGAESKRKGRLELAHGGTVFLDEVGELTPRLQARLLEFLQTKTVSPLGSNGEVRLDVRVIAATHRNLAAGFKKGEFREDLFHRLRVITICLKPLRARMDELDGWVNHFLEEFDGNSKKRLSRISREVLSKFETYPWPGNIRELRNVLEYAMLSCEDGEVVLSDLPSWLILEEESLPADPLLGIAEVPLTLEFKKTLESFEKDYLQRLLFRFGGKVSRTARAIGVNKTTLFRKVRALNLSLACGVSSGPTGEPTGAAR